MTEARCYRNLHVDKWSVKVGDHPVFHATSLTLFQCRFKVWKGGRERVLREKSRNVHAFACGTPLGCAETEFIERWEMVRVSYNPYKADHFFVRSTGQRIDEARYLMLLADGSVWATTDQSVTTRKRRQPAITLTN